MEQVAAANLEEVALELQTDVTSVARVHARAVAESSQLADRLRVAHEALVDGVHRVLIGERALELSQLHAEEVKLLPLHEVVHQARAAAQRSGVTVDLALNLVIKVVENAALERCPDESQVKRVGVVAVLERRLIGCHGKAAKLRLGKNRVIAVALGCHRREKQHRAQ